MVTTTEVVLDLSVLDALDFRAHDEQLAILECPSRFILVAGADQSGKSITAGAIFCIRLYKDMHFKTDKATGKSDPLLYWLVAADYPRTRREFDYIADHMIALFV